MKPFAQLDRIAQLFKVLGDENRLRILCLLMEKEHNVTDIAASVGISQPAASSHLRILKNHSITKSRKDGKEVFYSLDDDHVYKILDQANSHLLHVYR